jgi:hypothetical protein
MCAVVPSYVVHVDEVKVRLMHQGGRLQGVIRTLMYHMPPSDAAKFTIDDRRKLLKSSLIAATPRPQQARDID